MEDKKGAVEYTRTPILCSSSIVPNDSLEEDFVALFADTMSFTFHATIRLVHGDKPTQGYLHFRLLTSCSYLWPSTLPD